MANVPKIDRERVLKLHDSGVPSSVIARRLGCSRASVNRILRDLGARDKKQQ